MNSYNKTLHFQKNEYECGCFLCNDLGLPCLFSIRLFRNNEFKTDEKKTTDPMKISLFNNEKFLRLISAEWFVSTHQKAFSPLVKHEQFKPFPVKHIIVIRYCQLSCSKWF